MPISPKYIDITLVARKNGTPSPVIMIIYGKIWFGIAAEDPIPFRSFCRYKKEGGTFHFSHFCF